MISPTLISTSTPAYSIGSIVAQMVPFGSFKIIDKVALNLTVVSEDFNNAVVGNDGRISFQAANFREGRNTWAFHPEQHWNLTGNPNTSGTAIKNSLHTQNYVSSADSSANAPFLQYDIFADKEGVYQLWGRGYTPAGLYWNLDGDSSDMRSMNLGSTSLALEWTNFGQFYTAGGKHTFSVYLGNTGTVILDQWFFTLESDFEETLVYSNETTPITLSESPFNTALRVRGLDEYGTFDDLGNPGQFTSWVSSKEIVASGKYNYILQSQLSGSGVEFNDGMSLEFWQIGGSSQHFASWDFNFVDSSVGNAMISNDFGQTFTVK